MVPTRLSKHVMPMSLTDLEWDSRILEAHGENELGGSSAIDDDGTTDMCTFGRRRTGEIVIDASKCFVDGALENYGRGEGSACKA